MLAAISSSRVGNITIVGLLPINYKGNNQSCWNHNLSDMADSRPDQPLTTSMTQETTNEHMRLLPQDAEIHSCDNVTISSRRYCGLPYNAVCCLFLYFFVEMYDMVTIAPLTALFEQSLCRIWYRNHDPSLISPGGSVKEQFCKLEHIQAAVAVVRGWKLAFDTLPGTEIMRLHLSCRAACFRVLLK